MAFTNLARKIACASVGALSAAGLLLGPAVPAASAATDQPTQIDSAMTALDHQRRPKKGSVLLKAVNHARAHPELYPPRGNAAGAVMKACPNPLRYSAALHKVANAHNYYIASRPLEWVRAGNAHKGPSGKDVWDPGEPMYQAGYRSYRAEIVADGFPTPEAAVRFWMQDDEKWKWGHRNIILDCTIQEAGPAHGPYPPNNHYFYTVDLGNK